MKIVHKKKKVKIVHTSGPELLLNLNCLDNKYILGTSPKSFNEFQNMEKTIHLGLGF